MGAYLGDGNLTVTRKVTLLRISLDGSYPGIIHECCAAIRRVAPASSVAVYAPRADELRYVQAPGRFWAAAFPQHGPGRKHTRKIELASWQQEIVDAHPRSFLRGLIHSDGCRTINRFKTKLPSGRVAEYEYPRYFFTNLSPDIRALFCATCDQLGVRWSQSNYRNISVSHRKSVAVLDEFIGPKA